MEVADIYSQFRQSLLAFIRSRIRRREDAEDILQNVFVRIAFNIGKLSDSGKLRSWIYTITRNAIIDYYRKNSSVERVSVSDGFEFFSSGEPDDATKGLDECMSRMIALLPEEYRDIIIDSEIRGIRQKDLAEKYNLAYSSVRSRVQRGRERLKQLYYNCCHIQTDVRGNILAAQTKNNCGGPCNSCNES